MTVVRKNSVDREFIYVTMLHSLTYLVDFEVGRSF
jgi:hypothetical protein